MKENYKKINFKLSIIPVFLLILAVCFSFLGNLSSYATLYCAYCGSVFVSNSSGTYYYHKYVDEDGNCPVHGTDMTSITLSYSSDDSEQTIANNHSNWLTTTQTVTDTEFATYLYESDGVLLVSDSSGSSSSGSDDDGGMAGYMLDVIFGLEETSTDSDGKSLASVFDALTVLEESCDTVIDTMEDILNTTLYRVFQAIALTIMIVYFLIDFSSRDVMREFGQQTPEMILKPFVRLIISMMFLLFSWNILKFFLALAQFSFLCVESLDTISSTVSVSGVSTDIKTTILEAAGYNFDAGLVDSINNIVVQVGLVIDFIIPFVLTLISKLAAIFVVFSRTVQLVILATISPLAMADLYGEHSFKETKAFDFIRKFAGTAFQCVIIALVFYLVNVISATYIEQMLDFTNATISDFANLGLYISVIKLVQVGAVIGSARTAKEVFGTS